MSYQSVKNTHLHLTAILDTVFWATTWDAAALFQDGDGRSVTRSACASIKICYLICTSIKLTSASSFSPLSIKYLTLDSTPLLSTTLVPSRATCANVCTCCCWGRGRVSSTHVLTSNGRTLGVLTCWTGYSLARADNQPLFEYHDLSSGTMESIFH